MSRRGHLIPSAVPGTHIVRDADGALVGIINRVMVVHRSADNVIILMEGIKVGM